MWAPLEMLSHPARSLRHVQLTLASEGSSFRAPSTSLVNEQTAQAVVGPSSPDALYPHSTSQHQH